jgi:hypothetical protein
LYLEGMNLSCTWYTFADDVHTTSTRDLTELEELQGRQVPIIVEDTIAWLEKHGTCSEEEVIV